MLYFPTSPKQCFCTTLQNSQTQDCTSGAWQSNSCSVKQLIHFSRAMPQQSGPEPRWLQDLWDYAAACIRDADPQCHCTRAATGWRLERYAASPKWFQSFGFRLLTSWSELRCICCCSLHHTKACCYTVAGGTPSQSIIRSVTDSRYTRGKYCTTRFLRALYFANFASLTRSRK